VPWSESHSRSFNARHEESDRPHVAALLETLEDFRSELAERFERTPGEITLIVHEKPYQLVMAQPWLPWARMLAAPAARRYLAGWYSRREIHVLSAETLEKRASNVKGSREALRLTPLKQYAHIVIGANNPGLPPPFTPASFMRYRRWAWLAEGAAAYVSGQIDYLRPAIGRRLREGGTPSFPPDARDAALLGGTVFTLLDEEAGEQACIELAIELNPQGERVALERAFGRPLLEIERRWREHLLRP
jgi:hypothetical protein